MKLSHTIRPTFDDPNVVSDAGVVPALRLGESAGLYDDGQCLVIRGEPKLSLTPRATAVQRSKVRAADGRRMVLRM